MGNVVPFYRRAVGIVVFRDDGKVLVGQRSAKKVEGVGTWQLPQGGYQGNETALQAAEREIQEEMGLKLKDPQLGLKLLKQMEPLSYEHPTWTHRGQTLDFLLFHWTSADLEKVDLNFEEVPEFTKADFFDWDQLISGAVDFKQDLYIRLRAQAEPLIRDHLQQQKEQQQKTPSPTIDSTPDPVPSPASDPDPVAPVPTTNPIPTHLMKTQLDDLVLEK